MPQEALQRRQGDSLLDGADGKGATKDVRGVIVSTRSYRYRPI